MALVETCVHVLVLVHDSAAKAGQHLHDPDDVLFRIGRLGQLGLHPEQVFGWMKTAGHFRRTRWLGIRRTQLAAYVVAAAYNCCASPN